MFKYRQEQKQKMTQHILSQEVTADTLTPALKTSTPFEGKGNLWSPLASLDHSACDTFAAWVHLRISSSLQRRQR